MQKMKNTTDLALAASLMLDVENLEQSSNGGYNLPARITESDSLHKFSWLLHISDWLS